MQQEPTTLQGFRDIEPLQAPVMAAPDSMAVVLLLIALILLLAYGLWRWFNSPKAKAKRRLARIDRQIRLQRMDRQQASAMLSSILCQTLQLPHVSSKTPLPEALHHRQEQWQAFTHTLSVARFSTSDMETTQLIALVSETNHWLKRWP
jgi:hypothetical protein